MAAVASVTIITMQIIPQTSASALDRVKQIKTVRISDGKNEGIASLYGNGENYINNLKVKVQFKNYAPYEIILDDGYSPYMETFGFGADSKFLFCSSQTGGSGGYGNYGVYRLNTASYQLLYDDKTDSERAEFTAVFKPNGFMHLTDNSTKHTLTVDVGYMDSEFYNLIFSPDGSVKEQQPYVNPISFVSPALNPAEGIFRLITYRSVTAVAEVNRLGYIVQTLNFEDNKFSPSFTEFSINL